MKQIKKTKTEAESSNPGPIWIYLLGGILIYTIIYPFMDKVASSDEVQASLIATALSLFAIYFGTYISQLITVNRRPVSYWWFVIMGIALVALICWLFVLGQHPLKGQTALNLLFFGLPFTVASLIAGLLISLVRSTVENRLYEAKINAAQSRTELSLLQSQLSPHFLFNTLNNMYGISITQHEKVPQLLLKLSELLRYSLYDARDQFVPIRNEIAYLNNYIEFEKIRMGERLNLRTAIENIVDERMMIAPMLLIVFVENAFKHSKNTTDEQVFVSMEIKTWGNFLQFSIRNSGLITKDVRNRFADSKNGELIRPVVRNANDLTGGFANNASGQFANATGTHASAQFATATGTHASITSHAQSPDLEAADASRRTGGLGLLNVQKRLELLYPGAYHLTMEAKENEFIVMLQLTIQQGQ